MSIRKFTISRSKEFYQAWPDVVLTDSGTLLCVFSECTHHIRRDYTRIMLTESADRGRTWSEPRPLTEGTRGLPYYYNCARINKLPGGRLVITVDRLPLEGEGRDAQSVVCLYFSDDHGKTWSDRTESPLRGIVPDKLTVIDRNRWILAAHRKTEGKLTEYLRYSDDEGKTWSDEVVVAHDPRYDLCEGSLLHAGGGELVMFLRENSGAGLPCMKVVSHDNGEHWSQVWLFPIPGCHRPTAGFLKSGNLLVTCRMMHGSTGGFGKCTQNLLAALSDRESALLEADRGAWTRILPLDYDRSEVADTGYSGWVQFDDGEIYVVNYIVDNWRDKAQIRGYSLRMGDFILE